MKKIIKSLPFVIYGIILFFTISFLFGKNNIVLVPIFLLLAKKLQKSKLSPKNYLKYGLIMLFIALMSYVTQINIYSKLIINFILIFLITFIYSDEYSPKNHFLLGLELLLLEAVPINIIELPYRLIAIIYSYILLITFLYFYKKITNQKDETKKSLEALIHNIKHIKTNSTISVKESYKQTSIYCHNIHANVIDQGGVLNKEEKFKFYLLLHFEYLSQLVYDISKTNLVKKDYKYFTKLSKILSDYSNHDKLKTNITSFIKNYHLKDEYFNKDFTLVLNSLVNVLTNHNDKNKFKTTKPFKTRLKYLINRANINTQSFRYAIQTSIVILLCFTITLFIKDTHSIWIPITAYGTISLYPDDTLKNTLKYVIGMIIGLICFTSLTRYIPNEISYITMLFIGYFAIIATNNKIIKTIVGTQTAIISIYPDFGLIMSLLIRASFVILGFVLVMIAVKFILKTKKEDAFLVKIYELKKRERDLIFELEKTFKNKNPYNTGASMMLHLIIKELHDLRENQDIIKQEKVDKLLNYSYRFITDINKTAMILDQNKISDYDKYFIKKEIKLIDKVVKGKINFKKMPKNIYEIKKNSNSYIEFQLEKSRFTIGKFQKEVYTSKKK